MKFVIGRALTILSWDNPVTAFFRKSRKLRHSLGRPSRSDFVQFVFVVESSTTRCIESYSFYKFEFSGNAFKTIGFYRNDSNGNGVYDENDEYECNEDICTFEQWISSAEGYFSINKNGDVQILDMMEWKDYDESRKR